MEWTVLVTMLHPLYLQQLLRMGGVNTRIMEQLSTCNLDHLFFFFYAAGSILLFISDNIHVIGFVLAFNLLALYPGLPMFFNT